MENYNVNYSVHLPSYSIGPDCYNEVPYVTRFFGKTAVVLGGETAMEKAKPALLKGVEGSDVELLGFLPYGGDSTYENGNALIANPLVQKADMIFAMGGGRACDTGKYVADKLDKPLFTFPTVASNCASVTAISVIYNTDGSFREYYYPKLANHCFINSAVIADSPEQLLWAGIGDALSKECEAIFSSKDDTLAHCVYYGSTVTEHGHHHLHGEVVSLGVLCLLEHAGQFEEEDRLMRFNDSIGLPVCFDDVEIQESEFDKMADKFMQTTEWAHMPQGVTRENFLESMRRENAKGRAFKAAKK